ncbi:unnamed protein product [Ixodes persulcatus]
MCFGHGRFVERPRDLRQRVARRRALEREPGARMHGLWSEGILELRKVLCGSGEFEPRLDRVHLVVNEALVHALVLLLHRADVHRVCRRDADAVTNGQRTLVESPHDGRHGVSGHRTLNDGCLTHVHLLSGWLDGGLKRLKCPLTRDDEFAGRPVVAGAVVGDAGELAGVSERRLAHDEHPVHLARPLVQEHGAAVVAVPAILGRWGSLCGARQGRCVADGRGHPLPRVRHPGRHVGVGLWVDEAQSSGVDDL